MIGDEKYGQEKNAELQSIEIDKDFAKNHPDVVNNLSKYQAIISFIGQLSGIVCIIGGIILCLKGTKGSSDWSVAYKDSFQSSITNATPGIILIIAGLVIFFVTRYMVKIK